MSCSCDYDPPEFYHKVERRAIKDHACCECGQVIPKGTVYQYVSGKWDWGVGSFKTCMKCADIFDSLAELDYCVAHGVLQEEYQEYLHHIGSKKNAREIMRGETQ